jgi:hypothetical protein
MITKKDIPFTLVKAVEGIAQPHLDIIKFIREENTYYCFIERDAESNNYFKILIDGSKRIHNADRAKYVIEAKPRDQTSSEHGIQQATLQELETQLQSWIKLVREIHNTPSVHDDNFTKQYSEYYFKEFQIVDEDADISPFNPDQQDLIELYLTSLETAIESSPEVTEASKLELCLDIRTIRETLSVSTKNEVMKGVSKVFGKLYKHAKAFAKEIVKEAKKSLIKKLIELGIEYGPKILEAIINHHPN